MRDLIKKILTEEEDEFDWIRRTHVAGDVNIKDILSKHSAYSGVFTNNYFINELINVGLTDVQVEALSSVLDMAYESGHEDGEEEGREYGYDDGRSEGYDDGYDEGRSEGYDDGHRDGHSEGHSEGYDEGYQEGKSECEE